MKKIIYPCMAVAAMLSMASCSSDDVASDLGGDGVTVTLRLPSGLESKATFGDQNTVTLDELKYTVFEGTGENAQFAFLGKKENPFAGGTYKENVTLRLGKGKSYTIVFYADKENNGFVTYNDGNGQLTVNYKNMASNNEDYDAFYAAVEVTPETPSTVEAVLTRPFSQLNWGTDDLAEKAVTARLEGLTATVKVTNGLYTGMNLLTGKVIVETAVNDAVSFTATDVAAPTQENTPNFPVTGYDLLAMNYLLTGEGTIDCELAFSNGFSSVTVNAAPVNTNYRTNIYGSLLTNPVNFNITVDRNFEGSYEAETDAVVTMNENGKIICIAPALPKGVTVADLEGKGGVALNATGEPVYFEPTGAALNETMKQATEIYLAPNTTITTKSHIMTVPQSGVIIHGNGATISGGEQDFSISETTNRVKYEEGSTVNLNISNLNNVRVWGDVTTNCTINVNLTNCTMNGTETNPNLDLIMARAADSSEAIINITVDGCYCQNTINGIHNTTLGTMTIKNSTFKNTVIPVNVAKKKTAAKEVTISGCTFNSCGTDDTSNSAYDYAAPIRIVDNAGPADSIDLLVDNCTFVNTLSQWDILLMDYRAGKTWFPVNYNIENCAPATPTLRAE